MDDKLLFVQFPHPGGEHRPDNGLIKAWNKNCHKRKFMKQTGKYLTDAKDKKAKKGDIVFWGEWEPESKAERIDKPIKKHGPQYVYKPYYVVPESYEGLQNTDPFVFGDQFHYFGCKQPTFKQLSHLLPGSVILFGSRIDHAFVLDTVFVVGNRTSINHSSVKDLERHVCQKYMEVTVFPWYKNVAKGKACAGANSQKCRLYFGASYDKPIHGMYSFFPCQPYAEKPKGLARPRIILPGVITGNLGRGVKYTEQPSLNAMKLLWGKVVEQVKSKGLALGVYAEMPKRCITNK
ncbi:MAG: hypothetical protein ABSA41_11350 [Terriglobia bacterium]|jgi:hypothetical protein